VSIYPFELKLSDGQTCNILNKRKGVYYSTVTPRDFDDYYNDKLAYTTTLIIIIIKNAISPLSQPRKEPRTELNKLPLCPSTMLPKRKQERR
jgi:hypothetical protein